MVDWYYRYISDSVEVQQVKEERKILSTNNTTKNETWFTVDRYDDVAIAEDKLALPVIPSHRVGPISSVMMPSCHIGPRIVDPGYGKKGGGIEVATMEPIWLCGLRDLQFNNWDL